MMAALQAARDALAGIDDVKTCLVGIEPAISPGDYPLIRVVPQRTTPGRPYGNRTIEALIYFGMDTSACEGTELVYERLAEMEASIMGVLRTLGARYTETMFEPPEEELPPFKYMAVRCELQTANA